MRTQLAIAFIFLWFATFANNPKKELDNNNVYDIILSEGEEEEFRTGYVECELENGQLKLRVSGIEILQKVRLEIVAADPNQPIDIQLLKENWDDIVFDEKNVTDLFKKTFHVYPQFGIKVNSKYPNAKFYVAVFVSPELQAPLSHLFYPANEYVDDDTNKSQASAIGPTDSSSNRNSMLMYIIAFLLLIIILLLMIFLFKKNKKVISFSVCLLMISIGQINAGIRPMSAKDWTGLRATLGMNDMTDIKQFQKMIAKLNSQTIKLTDITKSLLSANNRKHIPSIDPRGLPSLPSSCYEVAKQVMDQNNKSSLSENSAGCKCLEVAYEKFYDNYIWFEKLRIITEDVKKSTEASIAFGDNVSGMHGVSGLAWQAERVKIMASMEVFDETYDKKFLEFSEELHTILQDIDKCEHDLGFPNWYRKVGFMYYQFTKVRYER